MMSKQSGLLFATLILAAIQLCMSSPPLYTCAAIPHRGCRFGTDQTTRCPSACSYFFDAIESALVGDKSSLYTLQRAFFPEGEQKPNVVDIYITLVLEQVIDVSCDSHLNMFRDENINNLPTVNITTFAACNNSLNCSRKEYQWHHVWTSAVLTNVIERESLGLISSINSFAYITRLYSEAQTNLIITTEPRDFQPRETAFLELNIPNLFCLPDDTEATLQHAWEEILPWVHVYAQIRGRISFSDGERAFIFEDSNVNPDSERIFGTFQPREVDENVFVIYLTTLHVLLQVAIGLTIMKLIPTYYKSISKVGSGKKVRNSSSVSIFWSNVFFAILLDVSFACLDLYLIVSVYRGVDGAIQDIIISERRSALQTVFAFGMLGILVTFFLILLQFFVAAGITKNTELYTPGVFKVLCCFFRCHCPCKKANREFWNKVLQTFALWFIMVFLQLVAGSVIPYLVLAIVNPVPAVTFLALGASTLFCLIIFIASLFQLGGQLKKSTCYQKCIALLQGIVFIVFLGLVAITVIIYQGVIQSGTDTGVIAGIVLSLVPSGIIAVLGFAVKSKLLSEVDEDDANEKESLLTRATSIFRARDKKSKVSDAQNQREDPSVINSNHSTNNEARLKNAETVPESERKSTSETDASHAFVRKTNLNSSESDSNKVCELSGDKTFKNVSSSEGSSGMGEDGFRNPSTGCANNESKSCINESLESGVGPVVYNNENGDIVLTVHFSDVGNAANA